MVSSTIRASCSCDRSVAGLELARQRVRLYLDGSTLDKSAVSSSGVVPATTPFFCKRNAMIFVELMAETEPGARTSASPCARLTTESRPSCRHN